MPYRPSIDEKLCFVLMPFRSPFDGYYKHVIKPTGEAAGLVVRWADEIYGTKPIIQDIWNAILRARVIVADVTDRNANVNYELGLCHSVGVPTILITKRMEDVPFDYRHRRCIVYDTEEAGWEQRLGDDLRMAIVTTIAEGGADGELRWPYDTIEAGQNVRMTKYSYADVIDNHCEYVLLTGTNFGDQLGTRNDPVSPFYDQIVKLLTSNATARVHLVFAPPDLLKKVSPPGYKDLVEKSLPRMWDLAADPRLANQRNRLRISCHSGAMFMSIFVRDPDNTRRALIVTTPRWVSDTQGLGRMFFAVWRSERPELFDTLWQPIYSNLRTDEGQNLTEVVERLGEELGQGYVDFVHNRVSNWRRVVAPDEASLANKRQALPSIDSASSTVSNPHAENVLLERPRVPFLGGQGADFHVKELPSDCHGLHLKVTVPRQPYWRAGFVLAPEDYIREGRSDIEITKYFLFHVGSGHGKSPTASTELHYEAYYHSAPLTHSPLLGFAPTMGVVELDVTFSGGTGVRVAGGPNGVGFEYSTRVDRSYIRYLYLLAWADRFAPFQVSIMLEVR